MTRLRGQRIHRHVRRSACGRARHSERAAAGDIGGLVEVIESERLIERVVGPEIQVSREVITVLELFVEPRAAAGLLAQRRLQLTQRVVGVIEIIPVLERLFCSFTVQIINVGVRIEHRAVAFLQTRAEEARDAVESVRDVTAFFVLDSSCSVMLIPSSARPIPQMGFDSLAASSDDIHPSILLLRPVHKRGHFH